ncbi:anti-sigma B factor antagonist [Thermophagus xiamenensis]|uniref:Anti-sigma factor antagonist n=2 Tax=Thermophagus xiamenensis TaxID=385682 RepID=A0A1I2DA20_9BACT|nr:anti-sigma B factor antagonist [Thermophagus xiamenensis]
MVGTINHSDRLNATIAPEIKDQLNNQLNKSDVSFVLDLQNIRFIDSTGIAVLISALKTARQNNRTFYLANIQKEVKDLLALMKLDKVFDYFEE